MRESQFQSKLIKRLKIEFPGIEIMKQDAQYKAAIPDLVLFFGNRYAMLECKQSRSAHHQPNQDYYVNKFSDWAFASFVYPENEEEVIQELHLYFH